MAKLTKVSSYRSGAPRFGTRSYEKFDNSVKVSYLSPEELEEYRSGRKGGSRMYTYDDYLKFKAEGLNNKQIALKMSISEPTLYKRLKVWEGKPLKSQSKNAQEPQKQKEKASEGERKQEDKSGELVALIATLRAEKDNSDLRIKELEKQLQAKDEEISSLENAANDLEKKLTAPHAVTVENPVNSEEISKLKKELYDSQELYLKVKNQLQETEDNMQEVLGTNENLHKEILIMNDSVIRSTELLNGASDEIEKLTKKYEDLKREVEPLRQLALMKLQQDVSA